MRGSQKLDDTVNFLSIPSTMRPGICAACHMLQTLGQKRACVRVTMYTGRLRFHSERLHACSLAFQACCGSVVHAGLCFFTTTISHSTHVGRKHSASKTKRPRLCTSRLTGAVSELSLPLLLIHFHVCPVAPISWQTLPTDGPDGWFGRSVIGAWPLINT